MATIEPMHSAVLLRNAVASSVRGVMVRPANASSCSLGPAPAGGCTAGSNIPSSRSSLMTGLTSASRKSTTRGEGFHGCAVAVHRSWACNANSMTRIAARVVPVLGPAR